MGTFFCGRIGKRCFWIAVYECVLCLFLYSVFDWLQMRKKQQKIQSTCKIRNYSSFRNRECSLATNPGKLLVSASLASSRSSSFSIGTLLVIRKTPSLLVSLT